MNSLTLIATTVALLLLHLASAVDVLTLDLTTPSEEGYKSFIKDIRTNLQDKNLKYGGMNIPVVGAPTGTFIRVNIQAASGTVSLGISRNNLYVVAYMAKNDKMMEHAYFFERLIKPPQLDALFPEAKGEKNQQKLDYTERYTSIENAGKTKRKKAGLGVGKLIQYMDEVNKKERVRITDAKFLLVAIQMVSEAARFAYIEDLIIENFPNGFTPEDKVILLESNWGDISKDVKGTLDGKFTEPITYHSTETSTTWTVSDAKELKVGLFSYVEDLSISSPTMSFFSLLSDGKLRVLL